MNWSTRLSNRGTVGDNGKITIERTKRSLKVKLLRMSDDVEVCEDEHALIQRLEKSANSSYSLLTSMMQHKRTTSTLSAAIPKGSAPETKNRGPETFLFHQTKDTEEKYQVGKTKQGREDGDD